jgi:hypothetical protein
MQQRINQQLLSNITVPNEHVFLRNLNIVKILRPTAKATEEMKITKPMM